MFEKEDGVAIVTEALQQPVIREDVRELLVDILQRCIAWRNRQDQAEVLI